MESRRRAGQSGVSFIPKNKSMYFVSLERNLERTFKRICSKSSIVYVFSVESREFWKNWQLLAIIEKMLMEKFKLKIAMQKIV